MLVLLLLLVIAAMALGILGIVVKGLLYLLFTGIGVLLVAFFLGACGCDGEPGAGVTPGNLSGPRRLLVVDDADKARVVALTGGAQWARGTFAL